MRFYKRCGLLRFTPLNGSTIISQFFFFFFGRFTFKFLVEELQCKRSYCYCWLTMTQCLFLKCFAGITERFRLNGSLASSDFLVQHHGQRRCLRSLTASAVQQCVYTCAFVSGKIKS